MATKILPLTTLKLDMTRPGSLAYSLCLLLTVPKLCGGARCVKYDLVVLPKALEEPQGPWEGEIMNTSGYGAAPYPAKVVDGKILVALSEFSVVPISECK